MARDPNACLVCGKKLVYYNEPKEMKCEFCHKKFMSYACCEDGHYVCDDCHEKEGLEVIQRVCLKETGRNPVKIAQKIMLDPYIYMHGPEHHVMVGAALLTAYHNAGGEIDLKNAIAEMVQRGRQYPGGSCGFWGCCGAAVSVGMFASIVTETTPLSEKTWGWANEATSKALAKIGSYGGPRCCKRNSFTAMRTAAEFTEEKLGVKMEMPERIVCGFFNENAECLVERCPYHPDSAIPMA